MRWYEVLEPDGSLGKGMADYLAYNEAAYQAMEHTRQDATLVVLEKGAIEERAKTSGEAQIREAREHGRPCQEAQFLRTWTEGYLGGWRVEQEEYEEAWRRVTFCSRELGRAVPADLTTWEMARLQPFKDALRGEWWQKAHPDEPRKEQGTQADGKSTADLEFCGQEGGVTWYVRQVDKFNRLHIFDLGGQRVEGGWVNGRYVFQLLVRASEAQRTAWLQARAAGLPTGEIGALDGLVNRL